MNKYGTPWKLRECPKTWAIDTENGDGLTRLNIEDLAHAELICAAPRMMEALKLAKTEFEARDGAGTCPVEIEELLEEFSQHNAKTEGPPTETSTKTNQ